MKHQSIKVHRTIINNSYQKTFVTMRAFAVLFVAGLVAVAIARPQGGGGGGGAGGGGDEHVQHPHHATSHQRVYLKNEHVKKIEVKGHPKFHYGYGVEDKHTHDIKHMHETRDGHHVKGEYSLLEPDHKHIRVVQYESDKKTGFVAKVSLKKV